MVFGRTYCQLTRLPIEDGDECILIPIEPGNDGRFEFIAEPVKVVYGGNVGMIHLPGNDSRWTDVWRSFMLLRVDAWELLTRDAIPIDRSLMFPPPGMGQIKRAIYKIQEKTLSPRLDVPEWMSRLHRLAEVLGRLGAQLQDHTGNDQSGDGGETLWRIIDEIRGGSTDKDEPSPVP